MRLSLKGRQRLVAGLLCLSLTPVALPVLTAFAHCRDTGDCAPSGRTDTTAVPPAATALPAAPTAVPAPPAPPAQTCTEQVPTLDSFLNPKRIPVSVGYGDIIIWDNSKTIWPTGSMTWDSTIQYQGKLADYFSRHQGDTSCPFYDRAERDWSQIEGHRVELINMGSSSQSNSDEATPAPTAATAPTAGPAQQASPVPPNGPSAQECSQYRILLQSALDAKTRLEQSLPDLEKKVAQAKVQQEAAQKALADALAQRGLKQTEMNQKISERQFYPSKIKAAADVQNWSKVAELNAELTKLQARIDQLDKEIKEIDASMPDLNQKAQNAEALLFAAQTNLSRARSDLLVAKADIQKYTPLVAKCNGAVSAA